MLAADGRLAEYLAQAAVEDVDVVLPARIAEFARIASGQRPKGDRKLVLGGHLRAFHQRRDHVHVRPAERPLDLEADEIVRVLQAAAVGAAVVVAVAVVAAAAVTVVAAAVAATKTALTARSDAGNCGAS